MEAPNRAIGHLMQIIKLLRTYAILRSEQSGEHEAATSLVINDSQKFVYERIAGIESRY